MQCLYQPLAKVAVRILETVNGSEVIGTGLFLEKTRVPNRRPCRVEQGGLARELGGFGAAPG